MKIYIGCDHRGVILKEKIIEYLNSKNILVIDTKLKNSEKDDYPDFAFEVGNAVVNDNALGILICGNGIGVSIAANKVKGIRCARVLNNDDVIKARSHNEANIIALSSELDTKLVFEMIDNFISINNFDDENHKRRVEKIIKYENGEYNGL